MSDERRDRIKYLRKRSNEAFYNFKNAEESGDKVGMEIWMSRLEDIEIELDNLRQGEK